MLTIRFVLMIAAASGLALHLATRTPKAEDYGPTRVAGIGERPDGPLDPTRIQMIWQQDISGEEPEDEPEFSVRVTLDPTDGKNRVYYEITEANGFYVDSFKVDFWYKKNPDMLFEDSPLAKSVIINDYLKADETLEGCLEWVPAELREIYGDMGTSENWAAEVSFYHRARLENPETLPTVVKATSCD